MAQSRPQGTKKRARVVRPVGNQSSTRGPGNSSPARKTTMAIEQHHLDTYRTLFIHRQDLYAQQTPKGAYFLKRSPITDTVLRSHLQGAITAGFYALSLENTT